MVGCQEIKQKGADGYVEYLSQNKCADGHHHTQKAGVTFQPYLLHSAVSAPTIMGDSRWLEAVGLVPGQAIAPEQWGRLVNGQNAATGAQLVQMPTAKQEAKSPRTALTDTVFSLPKSVSLEYFHLRAQGRDDLADSMLAAFNDGVSSALLGIQEEVKLFRVGSGSQGTRRAVHGSIGAIAFAHETARPVAGSAENPHLHLHAVIPNMGINAEGETTHVNNYMLRKHYLPLLNTLATQHMRTWFTDHGYETYARTFQETRKPCIQFDLVNRDEALEERFSLRGRTIKETIATRELQRAADLLTALQAEARATGAPEPERLTTAQSKRCRLTKAQCEAIAHDEKEGKTDASADEKRSTAAEEMAAAGYQSARNSDGGKPIKTRQANLPELIAKALGRDGLTQEATFFDDGDIATWVGVQAVKHDLSPAELRYMLHQVREQVVTLPSSDEREMGLFTTRQKMVEEAFTDMYLDHLMASRGPRVTRGQLDTARAENLETKGFDLSEDQAIAVKKLLEPRAASLLVGPAGSGKTAALRIVAKTYEAAGYTCLGVSTSNVAKKLLEEAQITSFNAAHVITALQSTADNHDPMSLNMPTSDGRMTVDNKTVLVLDEGSFTSSRQYHDLFEIARRRGVAKIILIGDPSQLPVVGRHGAWFSRIVEKHHDKAAILHENRRQGDESYEALCSRLLRGNHNHDYLLAKMITGQLHFAKDDAEAAQIGAGLFTDLSAQYGGRDKVLLMADVHRDRIAVNEALELNRDDEPQKIEAGEKTFEVDGRVQFEDNFKVTVARLDENGRQFRWANREAATRQHLVAANKEQGTVIGITNPDTDRAALIVRIDGEHGRDITIPVEDAREVLMPTSGITVHGAQGQSPEASVKMLTGNQMLTAEGSYVAQTRGKNENHIVMSRTWDGVEHSESEAINAYAERMSNTHTLPTTLDYAQPVELAQIREDARDIYGLDFTPEPTNALTPVPEMTKAELIAAAMNDLERSGIPGLSRRRDLLAAGVSPDAATDQVMAELRAAGEGQVAQAYAAALDSRTQGAARAKARAVEDELAETGKRPSVKELATARMTIIVDALKNGRSRPAPVDPLANELNRQRDRDDDDEMRQAR